MYFSYDGPLKVDVGHIANMRLGYTDEDSLIRNMAGAARNQFSDIEFDKLYLWGDKDLLVYLINNTAKEVETLNSDGSIDYISKLGEIAVITEFYTDDINNIIKRRVPADVIAKAIAPSYSTVISKADY